MQERKPSSSCWTSSTPNACDGPWCDGSPALSLTETPNRIQSFAMHKHWASHKYSLTLILKRAGGGIGRSRNWKAPVRYRNVAPSHLPSLLLPCPHCGSRWRLLPSYLRGTPMAPSRTILRTSPILRAMRHDADQHKAAVLRLHPPVAHRI